jgi:hypothetical protein
MATKEIIRLAIQQRLRNLGHDPQLEFEITDKPGQWPNWDVVSGDQTVKNIVRDLQVQIWLDE